MNGCLHLRGKTSGRTLAVDPAANIGSGSEGSVHLVPGDPLHVLKIFLRPDGTLASNCADKARKLEAMLASPPDDPERARGHVSISWPVELLLGPAGNVVGYTMPRAPGGAFSLQDVTQRSNRKRHSLAVNLHFLLGVARNLAASVSAVHACGHALCDLSGNNALVSERGLVTLIDTDSFEILDARTGKTIPTDVLGTPGFEPPELLRREPAAEDMVARDLFALALLIHQLLFEGAWPFAGVYAGTGDDPHPDAANRVMGGHYPNPDAPGGLYRPPGASRSARSFVASARCSSRTRLIFAFAGNTNAAATTTRQSMAISAETAMHTRIVFFIAHLRPGCRP